MREHIVAIHQPNFFPWLGYFDKIRRANTFIFLDDVQFPKTGGVWTNRVKILHHGEARWLTAAIERSYSGLRTINEMQFANSNWREKLLQQLKSAYAKAPFARETLEWITPLVLNPENNIAEYNIHAIQRLCRQLGLPLNAVRSSTLGIGQTATERLIALIQSVGGTQYLCGGGAEDYQQDTLFTEAGITLTYQQFTCRPYPQWPNQDFTPGLSVIDGLMFLGLSEMKNRIQRDT